MKLPKEFDFFDIDDKRLDEEWNDQPKYYLAYALKLSEAKEAYEKAKSTRELIESRLGHDIRSNPEKYGLEKVTDKPVEAAIIREVEYHEADQDVIRKKRIMDDLAAVVEALHQRKSAVEGKVYLFGLGYTAQPKLNKHQEKNVAEQEISRAFSKGKRT